jgi:hypothetical protein
MANIDKLNKEFKPKVVLTAEEMNEVVEKINELVDGVNEGGGGGGTTIEVANAIMYSVPAGNYQIRFLSCASENRYYNQAIYLLNGVDITSQMPNKSLINNLEWTKWFDITVGSEGLITFIVKTIKSGNIGFNAFEIKIL